jgi:hypothetical protein
MLIVATLLPPPTPAARSILAPLAGPQLPALRRVTLRLFARRWQFESDAELAVGAFRAWVATGERPAAFRLEAP